MQKEPQTGVLKKKLKNALQINSIRGNKRGTIDSGLINVTRSDIRAYIFSPDEGLCCIFSNRNYCYRFLTSYGVNFQNGH